MVVTPAHKRNYGWPLLPERTSSSTARFRRWIVAFRRLEGSHAYPVGVKGVVVGEGDSYEDALRDVQSALKFHLETFGADVLDGDEAPILEAFVAEASV